MWKIRHFFVYSQRNFDLRFAKNCPSSKHFQVYKLQRRSSFDSFLSVKLTIIALGSKLAHRDKCDTKRNAAKITLDTRKNVEYSEWMNDGFNKGYDESVCWLGRKSSSYNWISKAKLDNKTLCVKNIARGLMTSISLRLYVFIHLTFILITI